MSLHIYQNGYNQKQWQKTGEEAEKLDNTYTPDGMGWKTVCQFLKKTNM